MINEIDQLPEAVLRPCFLDMLQAGIPDIISKHVRVCRTAAQQSVGVPDARAGPPGTGRHGRSVWLGGEG